MFVTVEVIINAINYANTNAKYYNDTKESFVIVKEYQFCMNF